MEPSSKPKQSKRRGGRQREPNARRYSSGVRLTRPDFDRLERIADRLRLKGGRGELIWRIIQYWFAHAAEAQIVPAKSQQQIR